MFVGRLPLIGLMLGLALSSAEPALAQFGSPADGNLIRLPAVDEGPHDVPRATWSGPELRAGEAPPIGTFVNLDEQPWSETFAVPAAPYDWDWTILPTSLIYKSYLAGVKESRFSSMHVYNRHDGWLWDATLGARVGILRYGSQDPNQLLPQGWQFDVEGSAQARLDIPSDVDLRSVDFRGGFLLTRGIENFQWKFGYYHLSSHLGDEFLLKYPDYPRLNYVRDALVLGGSYYPYVFPLPGLRLYAETTWAFNCEYAEPWEFQFGLEIAPPVPTGIVGAPFFAINGHLRQEVNFGGNLVVETGWAWRGDQAGRLLRIGMMYFNGKSSQYSFYNQFEQQLGLGIWYDY